MARLRDKYETELKGQIQKTLGLKNVMEVPTHHEDYAEHGRRRGRG